jgi:hypothetical protein
MGELNLPRRSGGHGSRSHMTRVTNGIWTPEQLEILRVLLKNGVSPARASVVLKRPRLAVSNPKPGS